MITLETVRHVARLAKLDITDAEAKRFQKELDEVLKAFKILDKVKTEVEPFHPSEDIFREDKPENSLAQDEAFANTRHTEKGFFKGPRVV